MLSTVPVFLSHVSLATVPQVLLAGAVVMIDGSMKCPMFYGLIGIIGSYNVETNRYNLQLPPTDKTLENCHAVSWHIVCAISAMTALVQDNVGSFQIATIRPENLKLCPEHWCL